MNNTLEKRSMAFTNCPWKSTAGCNLICETCFRSDPKCDDCRKKYWLEEAEDDGDKN